MSSNHILTLNKLAKNRSTLEIALFPNTSFTLSNYSIPSVFLSPATQSSPFFDKPIYGDKLYYDDLMCEFLVNEDLSNYLEMHDWMKNTAHPEEKLNPIPLTYTDAIMTIYTSHNNPFIKIKFLDLIPVQVGSLQLSENTSETEEVSCMIVFKYQRFDIEFINQV